MEGRSKQLAAPMSATVRITAGHQLLPALEGNASAGKPFGMLGTEARESTLCFEKG